MTRNPEIGQRRSGLTINAPPAEVPLARVSEEAAARQELAPVLDGVFVTVRLIIRHSTPTDPRRFFLPFDHHLRFNADAAASRLSRFSAEYQD
jgi:hypothetical protein